MAETCPGSPSEIFQRLDRTAQYPYSAAEYIRRVSWGCVQATLIRLSPPRAYRWRRFWLRRFGAQLATVCGTKASTRVVHPWLLSLGAYAMIDEQVTIYNLGPVTIGDHSVISQDVYVCAGTHDYTQPHLPLVRAPVRIGSGVWICAGAFIGPGVTIGDNSIVGARAVVCGDVEPGLIVAGNPARLIKRRPLPDDGPAAH